MSSRVCWAGAPTDAMCLPSHSPSASHNLNPAPQRTDSNTRCHLLVDSSLGPCITCCSSLAPEDGGGTQDEATTTRADCNLSQAVHAILTYQGSRHDDASHFLVTLAAHQYSFYAAPHTRATRRRQGSRLVDASTRHGSSAYRRVATAPQGRAVAHQDDEFLLFALAFVELHRRRTQR